MGIKIIAHNKKASFHYSIVEKYEAGLSLMGSEVKSLWKGKGQIHQAFVNIDSKGEAWIHNMNIAHYEFANRNNHEETRKRKLLLHRREIDKIKLRVQKEDLTIVPIKLYFKKSHIKVEIGLAKGKKKADKREDMKSRQAARHIKSFTP